MLIIFYAFSSPLCIAYLYTDILRLLVLPSLNVSVIRRGAPAISVTDGASEGGAGAGSGGCYYMATLVLHFISIWYLNLYLLIPSHLKLYLATKVTQDSILFQIKSHFLGKYFLPLFVHVCISLFIITSFNYLFPFPFVFANYFKIFHDEINLKCFILNLFRNLRHLCIF